MKVKRYKLFRFRWKIKMSAAYFIRPFSARHLLLSLSLIYLQSLIVVKTTNALEDAGYHYSENYINRSTATEFTSTFVDGRVHMDKRLSPYIVRNDIVIRQTGELVVEPGVEVRFAPMTGITVYGVLTAKVIYKS